MYDWLIGPFVEFEFLRRALAGATALALGAGPIGVFLMLRRMSLVGDAMAHAILPGAAIGFLVSGLSLFAMTAGGLIAGCVVALLTGLVARMTELARSGGSLNKVLEIGTGCGYQAAVLSRIAKDVYSIERIAGLLAKARKHFRELRMLNIRLRHADGHVGMPEVAPFDAIVMVLEGTFTLTIGGQAVTAPAGSVVRMPANIPHAVDAPEPARMVLIMLREPKTT